MKSKVTYTSTRLHFKSSEIEPLANNEEFRITTPIGVWQMSKADFYKVFPNVVASDSYSGGRGEYHYTKPPAKSDQFLVHPAQPLESTPTDLEQKLRQLEDRIKSPFVS